MYENVDIYDLAVKIPNTAYLISKPSLISSAEDDLKLFAIYWHGGCFGHAIQLI